MKKKVLKGILISILSLTFILLVIFFISNQNIDCGDNTSEGNCSVIKPYFCSEGILTEKASSCGCPENLTIEENFCISKYQTEPKNFTLYYTLRGEMKSFDFVVYRGLADHLLNISKDSYNFNGQEPSRQNFKFRRLNEPSQRELLLPLVTEIQNLAKDKTDQVRIATSMVQMIPYGESEKSILLLFSRINSSRYAYETLYENKGACEGKSELLLFLLRELGYGTALIYYPMEDHEAVGISCPIKNSFEETGYCFIETTGPSILSNNEEYYYGWGRLTSSPQIIPISGGISLGKNLYEYSDAKTYAKLDKIVEETGELNIFRHFKFESLKEKYGLDSSIIL